VITWPETLSIFNDEENKWTSLQEEGKKGLSLKTRMY
jgi:hypothetical protein